MSDKWFRVPAATTQFGTIFPKYSHQSKVDGFSGNQIYSGSDDYVVRIYASKSVLDNIASNSDTTELGGVPTTKLNDYFGLNRTASEWENVIFIS